MLCWLFGLRPYVVNRLAAFMDAETEGYCPYDLAGD